MRLGVNIDHVATLRQARRGQLPDPVEAALICQRAGASHIVCHLREDRRHIQDADVQRLKRVLDIPLNLEMSIAADVVEAALEIRPASATVVPERRQELTTEGGLDLLRRADRIARVVRVFHERGIKVSLFIDPDPRQISAAHELGVRIIELHTGRYAQTHHPEAQADELEALRRAASQGRRLGMVVAAGHGLDYENVSGVAAIPGIEELNIGFSIIARAVFVGLEQAVREMVTRLSTAHDVAGERKARRRHAGYVLKGA